MSKAPVVHDARSNSVAVPINDSTPSGRVTGDSAEFSSALMNDVAGQYSGKSGFPFIVYDAGDLIGLTARQIAERECMVAPLPLKNQIGLKPKLDSDLPIFDPQNVQALYQALKDNHLVVLSAPTGSGKTTGAPILFQQHGYVTTVILPRRLQTDLCSQQVCRSYDLPRGEVIGVANGTLKVEDTTFNKILFATDMLALQRELKGQVRDRRHVVFFDEYHERKVGMSIHLAVLRRKQAEMVKAGLEPFRIVISSATMEAEKLAQKLGGGLVKINERARNRPAVKFIETEARLLVPLVVEAVKKGRDVNILLPGKPEVEALRAGIQEALDQASTEGGLPILANIIPLHSRSAPERRTEAATPRTSAGEIPTVILTTVGRSGLSLRGQLVIDLGLVRDLQNIDGVDHLTLRAVTKAEVKQGLGRAGRSVVEPGSPAQTDHFVYMGPYPQGSLQDYPPAEINRVGLAKHFLMLRAAGVKIGELRGYFDDAPTTQQIKATRDYLRLLGLTGSRDNMEFGKEVARFPVDELMGKFLWRVMQSKPDATLLRQACSLVAIYEADGLYHNESASEGVDRALRPNRPGRSEYSADLLVQLGMFNRVSTKREEAVRRFPQIPTGAGPLVRQACEAIDINYSAFLNAAERADALMKQLKVPHDSVPQANPKEVLRDALQFAFCHNIFERVIVGSDKEPEYLWRNRHGLFKLNSNSVIDPEQTQYIVGKPLVIHELEGEGHRVINFATPITATRFFELANPEMRRVNESILPPSPFSLMREIGNK